MSAGAFDAVAARYDAEFTDRRLGQMLRERVRGALAGAFAPGDRVLDLGCGTGGDAVWLARRGCRVTAIDGSAAMLAVARAKAAREAVEDRVTWRHVDLSGGRLELEGLEGAAGRRAPDAAVAESHGIRLPGGHRDAAASLDPGLRGSDAVGFDGAYSNFGALNCVADRGALAAELGRLVRPGGRVLLVVMGPFCAWETLGHLLRGRPRPAFRRLRRRPTARIGNGEPFRVWYPSARRLRRELLPWFRPRGSFAVGLLLPPSDFHDLVDRWPRLFATMAEGERRFGGGFPATWLSDHHVTLFERR
jgi:SAM-dependent methyltransferase